VAKREDAIAPRARMSAFLALSGLAGSILAANGALAQDWKPDAKWMSYRAANQTGEGLKASSVRLHCRCMAGLGDESEMLTWTQSELEHSYSPAHALCHKKAGWR
jgi:hypothetical protein